MGPNGTWGNKLSHLLSSFKIIRSLQCCSINFTESLLSLSKWSFNLFLRKRERKRKLWDYNISVWLFCVDGFGESSSTEVIWRCGSRWECRKCLDLIFTGKRMFFKHALIFQFPWNLPVCVWVWPEQQCKPVLQWVNGLFIDYSWINLFFCIQIHSGSFWWLDVIQTAIQYAIDEELVQRVQNEIASNYKQQTNKLSMAEK